MHIDDFHRYTAGELAHLCEVNEDMEVNLHHHEGIKYLRVTNFLKRPEKLAEFLQMFPAEDRNKTIAAGESTEIKSSAPGFQQYIKDFYFSDLNKKIFDIGKEYKIHRFKHESVKFDNFTNCCYPGMKAYNQNYLPHTDSFGLASNLYLTDAGNSATSFYRVKTKSGKVYHNEFDLRYIPKEEQEDLLSRYQYNTKDSGWSEWVHFEGDDLYEKYHDIPSEFNTLNMYKGNIWHSIKYNAETDPLRYSLVTAMIAVNTY